MFPNRLSIIGVGLLGGSIGLAVKSAGIPCHIVGYGHRTSTLEKALSLGAIDSAADSITAAVHDADLTILCTPVGLIGPQLAEIAPFLKAGAIVTDVGSTKRSITRAADSVLPKNVHFVGSHPMAGSDKRGVDFAKADLFHGAMCILTPSASSDAPAIFKVSKFWQLLGMRIVELSADEHDRRICDISHLPHLIAAALVAMQDETNLSLTGSGFSDMTRIAGGDGALWRDILQDNRDAVASSLERFAQALHSASKLLDPRKSAELSAWLDSVATRRNELPARRVRESQGE